MTADPVPAREAARALLAIETVARSIHAEHLQTFLSEAKWVAPDEIGWRAAQRLRGEEFDQAPVGLPGRLLGFALTAELEIADKRAIVRDSLHRLDAEHVLSADAGMLDVLESLTTGKAVAFVVAGHDVTGFVTASDVGKQPARTHFYLLLAGLEAALAEWVRDRYPDQEVALAHLGDEGKKVRSRFKRDQRNKVEVDLVTGMDLGHLLTVAGMTTQGLDRFGFETFGLWEKWIASLTSLRNVVMHPVLSVLGPQRSLVELAQLERGLRVVLGRADTASE
jgi:hypothetical protein